MLTSYDCTWPQAYDDERKRIIGAFGALTENGIVEQIAHIGATSVPGLAAQPCIDIGLSVWPYPLPENAKKRLADLGYVEADSQPGKSSAQALYPEGGARYRIEPNGSQEGFQLFFCAAGDRLWHEQVLIRDYLRHDSSACQRYSNRQASAAPAESQPSHSAYSQHKQTLLTALVDDAHKWWKASNGFSDVERVAQELKALPGIWMVSSGWAIDLFLEKVTRYHHDVDIVVDRSKQLTLQEYLMERGWKMVAPYKGQLVAWPQHMALQLPRHQVHAHRNGEFIDILLTDFPGGMWQFRREPNIVHSVDKVCCSTADGLNYLAPEVVLLFKAKASKGDERPQDQQDFENALPSLSQEQRAWLRWALLVANPNHSWLQRLV